jgi:NAD(P)-dependent dehydrogenase (short-subunit alcohol dehydrogenase family)
VEHRYSNIVITGASSGLGRALAIAYAYPGTTLHLSARNAARLAEVTATCRSLGAQVTETLADVTRQPVMEAWIRSVMPFDLVIANAGISAGPGWGNQETPEQVQAIFTTNVIGVFNTVLPAIAAMSEQPPGPEGIRGRIAIIGSIAGLIALPSSPAYCAAKAAVDVWVQASRPNLAKDGIALTLVRPGFVRTPMTAGNPYPMPGLMEADQAAAIIRKGLAAGRDNITFPYWLGWLSRLGDLVPKRLFDRFPKKPAGSNSV